MSDEIRVDGIFDAKLIRENKSAKGIFLTLEIAADDYFAAKLSDVRPGALLKIGYQEIVDVSVQPIGVNAETPQPHQPPFKREPGKALGDFVKPKKRFSEYPLSQQCAMRCEDESFREFMVDRSGILDEDVPAHVRGYCGVNSRAELSTNAEAARLWHKLNVEYEEWLTDKQYAESRR